MYTLSRVQARFRGLIVRKKVKSANKAHTNIAAKGECGKYHFIQNSKIVRMLMVLI